ncbi:hypothetical protein ACO0LM_25100 [Undibacterium sp. Di26W]|uniref:hypothetical protein n=1 Tax=Undibacterium sp. Di26W TaxID=3413035 RepID=UPI003BF44D5F
MPPIEGKLRFFSTLLNISAMYSQAISGMARLSFVSSGESHLSKILGGALMRLQN